MKTKNTLRFWFENRITWLMLALFCWMNYCTRFTPDKYLWLLLFGTGCGILGMALLWVWEHPTHIEWLMVRKWGKLLFGKDIALEEDWEDED